MSDTSYGRNTALTYDCVGSILAAMVDEPKTLTLTHVYAPSGLILRVRCNASDVGKLVGRQGRTARALRTVLMAISKQSVVPQLDISAHDLGCEGGQGLSGSGRGSLHNLKTSADVLCALLSQLGDASVRCLPKQKKVRMAPKSVIRFFLINCVDLRHGCLARNFPCRASRSSSSKRRGRVCLCLLLMSYPSHRTI